MIAYVVRVHPQVKKLYPIFVEETEALVQTWVKVCIANSDVHKHAIPPPSRACAHTHIHLCTCTHTHSIDSNLI